MPKINEVTVCFGPTLKVGETYLKASVSVTAAVEEDEAVEDVSREIRRVARAAYRQALLDEVRLATRIQRQTTLGGLVTMLTGESDGEAQAPHRGK